MCIALNSWSLVGLFKVEQNLPQSWESQSLKIPRIDAAGTYLLIKASLMELWSFCLFLS